VMSGPAIDPREKEITARSPGNSSTITVTQPVCFLIIEVEVLIRSGRKEKRRGLFKVATPNGNRKNGVCQRSPTKVCSSQSIMHCCENMLMLANTHALPFCSNPDWHTVYPLCDRLHRISIRRALAIVLDAQTCRLDPVDVCSGLI
jgi:hypothetical protein